MCSMCCKAEGPYFGTFIQKTLLADDADVKFFDQQFRPILQAIEVTSKVVGNRVV